MDRHEAARRDRVMRAYFEGKDWDHNDEFVLKRQFVARSAELLPAHPFLIDDEWDVVAGETNQGRGDLVFTDGEGGYAVVEVKYLRDRSGRTARSKRTKSRKEVREQAVTYARAIASRIGPDAKVSAYAYTNEAPDTPEKVGGS
jgi:hypothetical protein